jgi:sialic acid synthase SpsE
MPCFVIDDPKSPWVGRQLYDLYDAAHTPWDWHSAIIERAASQGLHCFSTPFDDSAVDFLESLNVPAYKIASFENTDLPLIRRLAATAGEIDEAVRAARDGGCRDLVLLKCTSTYPATAENTNISTIPHMRALFGCEVGMSDHTMGCGVSVAATALVLLCHKMRYDLHSAFYDRRGYGCSQRVQPLHRPLGAETWSRRPSCRAE